MSDSFVEDAMASISEACAGALDAVLSQQVEAIKDDLSIPVEYSGSHVIRSQPGENPRLETGELQRGIGRDMQPQSGDEVSGTLTSTTPYGAYLNPSRPFWTRAETRLRDALDSDLSNGVAERL